MIETERQRRWWFATHPEYRSSGSGARTPQHDKEDDTGDKVSPENVDAYVDNALKYVDGPLADFLKSIKRNFGTEGSSQDSYEEPETYDWQVAAGAGARVGRRPGNRRGGRDRGEIRDWFLISRHHRQQMDFIEAELGRAGANQRDYRFTSYQGSMVAQRDSTFDPHQRGPQGRTNIERMRDGRPPLDREEKEVVLHHGNQKNEGPMIELTRAEHLNIAVRLDPSQINRQESNSFRRDYWRTRAESFKR
jgi:hypothetical protein